jgi:hypothetical protein
VVLGGHIDNALLTSSRTVTGQNNTVSMSMKIVHNKFTPHDMMLKGKQSLYQVNEEIEPSSSLLK